MSTDPEETPKNKLESERPETVGGLVPEQIEIEVTDPSLTEDFDEADFDHEFDDDFEEEVEGEYDLEDDQYGEDFHKEFGHLTKESDDDDLPVADN